MVNPPDPKGGGQERSHGTHQSGRSENHRLKSTWMGGEYVSSQEAIQKQPDAKQQSGDHPVASRLSTLMKPF